jgi:tRNA (mo5U34)-methyltransferase
MDPQTILERAKALAPWHHDFELVDGVRTGSLNSPDHADPAKRGFRANLILDPSHLKGFFKTYYPNGLAGKRVLDVGCNAGGYCFVAGELGAAAVVGFDPRQHWIDQAHFIHQVRFPQLNTLQFETCDLDTFISRPHETDVTIFKGVFYHLADPIHALLKLCDMTREVMFVNTECDLTVPEHCLAPRLESKTLVMSGVQGLCWWPGGPAAIKAVLEYAGFADIRVPAWQKDVENGKGRFTIIGRR